MKKYGALFGNSQSQEKSKRSPKARQSKSLNSRPLTLSEIESLRKDMEESSLRMDELLKMNCLPLDI